MRARAALVCGVVVAVASLAAGCGGEKTAPGVSNLTLSSSTIKPGDTITATVTVSDTGGLADLKLAYSLGGPAAQPEQIMSVTDVTAAMKEAPIALMLTISAAAPAGTYTLKVAAIDGAGNRSADVSTTLTVQP
jgi:hypothetical protein